MPEGKDYYLPDDLTERTIRWIHDQKAQSPDKPFFIYYATGASHSPHHVPKAWADKYKGKFDQGWDKLREETFARQKELGVIPAERQAHAPRPGLPRLGLAPADEKKLYARQMEVYAGFQENTDYQVGRVVQAIEEMGQADNTLILYIWGDNGSSMEGTETGTFNEMTTITGIPLTAEQQLKLIDAYGGMDAWGGPVMQPHFACAWAWAGNTPFQWGKQVASHLGGTRNPMVVSWPTRIKDKGGLRSQFTHVIDVAPDHPRSRRHPAARAGRRDRRRCRCTARASPTRSTTPAAKERHTQQYFEIFGNRAMYKDGWIACARLDRIPWKLDPETLAKFAPGSAGTRTRTAGSSTTSTRISPRRTTWRPSIPRSSRELQGAVLGRRPRSTTSRRCWAAWPRSSASAPPATPRTTFTYYPGTENIGAGMIPPIYNRSFTITADLDVPAGRRRGCDRRRGRRHGRLLALRAGRQAPLHLQLPRHQGRHAHRHARNSPTGKVQVRYEFTADEPGKPATGGRGRLFVNDKQVGENRTGADRPASASRATRAWTSAETTVSPCRPPIEAKSPFAFTGTIGKVVFELAPKSL